MSAPPDKPSTKQPVYLQKKYVGLGIVFLVLLPSLITWQLTIIIGLGVLVLAMRLARQGHRWLRSAEILSGTVVEIVAFPIPNRVEPCWQPRVRYTARDGIVRDFMPYISKAPDVQINDRMTVAYHAATQDARGVTFGRHFGLATVLAVLGAALVVLSAAFLTGRQYVPRIYTGGRPLAAPAP